MKDRPSAEVAMPSPQPAGTPDAKPGEGYARASDGFSQEMGRTSGLVANVRWAAVPGKLSAARQEDGSYRLDRLYWPANGQDHGETPQPAVEPSPREANPVDPEVPEPVNVRAKIGSGQSVKEALEQAVEQALETRPDLAADEGQAMKKDGISGQPTVPATEVSPATASRPWWKRLGQ